MNITKHWNITREDGSEYVKFFFVDGKTLELDVNTSKFSLKGKTGRAIGNENSLHNAVKQVSSYFDSIEV